MKHLVIDVEINVSPDELPNGWDDTDKLGVACAVVYDMRADRFEVYEERDVPALRDRLLTADRISGYNIWKFDFPVIFGLPGRERVEALRPKTDDILARIWRAAGLDPHSFAATHKGYGLGQIAPTTISRGKIGFGGDAPKWWKNGERGRTLTYCLDDVALERDLMEFIDRFGYVVTSAGRLAVSQDWTKGGI